MEPRLPDRDQMNPTYAGALDRVPEGKPKRPIGRIVLVSIGMLLSAVSWLLLIFSLIAAAAEPSVEPPDRYGVSTSFGLWVYSAIVAMIAMIPYVADGVFCIARAVRGRDRLFNIALAALVAGAIPMVICVGGKPGIHILIWNLYHLALFVMEIVSLKKAIEG